MENTFLGIDLSTQGCKLVCINLTSTSVDYIDSIDFDADLPQYNTLNGVIRSDNKLLSESDPNMWLDALEILFQRMRKSGFAMSSIRAISVSGQQHGLVSLDEEGNLTRSKSKLWNDFSTNQECELLNKQAGGKDLMIREIGNTQRLGYTAGKIYHLFRNEPGAAKKTVTFFLVHNFINWYLTGGKKNGVRVMEPGDTSGMALRHPAKNEWSKTICDIISPTLIQKLPPVKPSDQFIGNISIELANKYGFSKECYIDAGSGDNMYSAIGTGNIKPGIITISLGTSGTAYTILDEPWVDPIGEIALFCDSTGKYLPLLCVANMANGYNQILKDFKLTHDSFSKILDETPPANNGRIIFPWYSGERTPDLPNAAPVYWGFALDDFTPSILCRGVLEGHVLNLYDGFRRMPVQSNEIRLTGGLSKSDAWCQAISDIFEIVTVPAKGEGTALGAALHAAWVYNKNLNPEFKLAELTNSFFKLDNSKRKFPKNIDDYRKLKNSFSEISARLRKNQSKTDPFLIFSQMNSKRKK